MEICTIGKLPTRVVCLRQKMQRLYVYKVRHREVKHPPRVSTALEGRTWTANRYWAPRVCSLPLLFNTGNAYRTSLLKPLWTLSDSATVQAVAAGVALVTIKSTAQSFCKARLPWISEPDAVPQRPQPVPQRKEEAFVLDLPLHLPISTSDQSQHPNFITFFFFFQYSQFVILCQFQMYSKVNQLYVHYFLDSFPVQAITK